MKRYIYILIGIVVLAALVVLGLFLWKNSSLSLPSSQTGTTGSLPSTGTQGSNGGTSGQTGGTVPENAATTASSSQVVAGSFGPVSTDPVLNYFIAPNNTVLMIEPTGIVAQVVNGQTSDLSTSSIANVISGGFSYDGKKAFIAFGDPQNPQTDVFDLATKTWTPLPQGMHSPQWSPSDYRIAFLASVSTGTETLAVIDMGSAKHSPVSLLSLYVNDLSLQWIKNNQFVLVDRPSSHVPGSAMLFDSQKQSVTILASAIPGLEGLWGLEGLLFWKNNSGGNSLELDDLAGNTIQALNFETLPTKCGFGEATASAAASTNATSTASAATSTPYLALYCGVPRDQATFAAATLPDDYNQMALFTSDDIYRLNTQTGAFDLVWNDASQNVDVSDVHSSGNLLFFINRYNNELYTLTIQPD